MTDTTDDLVWPVLVIAETCLCAAWDDVPDQKPAHCTIVPGRDVNADNCCEGQAWVRLAQVVRSSYDGFPATLQDQTTNCPDVFWAIDLGVGVLRCAPTGADDSLPATDAQLRAAALGLYDDMARVRAAMMCCLQDSVAELAGNKEWRVFLGPVQTIGPEGGCVGFEMQVAVGLQWCADC